MNDRNDTSLSDEEPLDPAEMLALLDRQQRSIESKMGGFVPTIMAVWGIAWLIGFGALWLIDGLQPQFGLPVALAVWIFAVLMVIAFGTSMWLGIRSGRGIRPSAANAFTGTVYGVTWSVGAIALAVFGAGLGYNGMSAQLANVFYPSAYVLFVGIMYLVSGAIWHAVPAVVTGGWMVLLAVIAPFIPYPWASLFFAVAGGGFFLVFAVISLRYLRREQALVAGAGHDA